MCNNNYEYSAGELQRGFPHEAGLPPQELEDPLVLSVSQRAQILQHQRRQGEEQEQSV